MPKKNGCGSYPTAVPRTNQLRLLSENFRDRLLLPLPEVRGDVTKEVHAVVRRRRIPFSDARQPGVPFGDAGFELLHLSLKLDVLTGDAGKQDRGGGGERLVRSGRVIEIDGAGFLHDGCEHGFLGLALGERDERDALAKLADGVLVDPYGGQRDLPRAYRDVTNNGANTLGGATLADRLSLLQALPNLFDLQRIDKAPADFGGSLSYGNVYKLGGTQKFGFQVTGLYDTNFRFRRERRGVFTAGGGGGQDVSRQDVEDLQRSEQTFETGGTLGLGYEYSKQHKVDFVTLLSRQTQKGAFFGRAVAAQVGNAGDEAGHRGKRSAPALLD